MFIRCILVSAMVLGCSKDAPERVVRGARDMASGSPMTTYATVVPHDVGVQLVPQHTPQWCWAASGEMVMSAVAGGRRVPQCRQATDQTSGGNDCCQEPVPRRCIHSGWPRFGLYAFTNAPRRNGPLSWDEIKQQIDVKKSPVAFSWRIIGKGAHMMTLGGYAEDQQSRWVTVYDPLEVDKGSVVIMAYDAYVKGPDYRHYFDYFDVAVAP